MLFGAKMRWAMVAKGKQNGSWSPLVSGWMRFEEGSQEGDLPNETRPLSWDCDRLMVGV